MRHHHAVQKSDERILGNGQFVDRVLREAEEGMEHRFREQVLGIDLATIIWCVCEVTGCGEGELRKSGKDRKRVQARSLLCYWAVRELSLSQTDLAKRLRLSPAGISLSVKRGEALVQQLGCELAEVFTKLKK
jgi:putative transposase